MTYPHSCIKCGAHYSDEDVDAYLCDSCVVKKKEIAAKVDAMMAMRPKRNHVSELQQFDSLPKVMGFTIMKNL